MITMHVALSVSLLNEYEQYDCSNITIIYFTNMALNVWNSLPNWVVMSDTVNT